MIKDKNKLRLAIIQSSLHWEDEEANISYFTDAISGLEKEVDLLVLPETFLTGFTMNVKKYADSEGKGLNWMRKMAEKYALTLCGSLIIKEGDSFFNRLYFVESSGKVQHYDKRHLFTMGREDKDFSKGRERKIVKLGNFNILLQICYDLRFPVFVRNRGEYDVLLYVANWPTAREKVWEALLPARAIENQAYIVAANRMGEDGEGHGTCGKSCVIDPKGNKIARLNEQAGVLYANLDLLSLQAFRKKFPVLQDADDFEIRGLESS